MTHNVENRLRSALEARAALVDTLPADPTLRPATSPWRRAAPVLLAVAAVALLVLGLVLLPRGGPAPQPLPPVDRPPEPVPGVTGDLSGDLTGDGRDDVATLAGNQLRVELATGEVLTARVGRAERLLGIVDLEQEPGVAVVTRQGAVTVWVVRDELTELHEDGAHALLSVERDGRRAWIDPDGGLLDAAYVVGDPVPVTLAVRRWVAEGDGLRPVPQPMHCGDPDADGPPTPCRATPVGSDADQPDLRAPGGGMRIDEGTLTPPGEPLTLATRTFTVVGAPEGDAAWDSSERGELVMRDSGVERRVQLPSGGVTGIVPVPYSDMVAVIQASPHGEDWTFVQETPTADLVVLTEPEETPIDGQWVGFFDRTTWITEDGLFTRETIAEFGIHRLWRWEVADGALVPVELGRLCLDDNARPTAYGAC